MGICLSCIDNKYISLNENNIDNIKKKIHVLNNEIVIHFSSNDDL